MGENVNVASETGIPNAEASSLGLPGQTAEGKDSSYLGNHGKRQIPPFIPVQELINSDRNLIENLRFSLMKQNNLHFHREFTTERKIKEKKRIPVPSSFCMGIRENPGDSSSPSLDPPPW